MVYIDPPEDATENVKSVCKVIQDILNGVNASIIYNMLKDLLRQLSPAEKEQLKRAHISQTKNSVRRFPADIRPVDITPYPYPETEIGQINPLSPPFDNDGWDTLLNILKEHQII